MSTTSKGFEVIGITWFGGVETVISVHATEAAALKAMNAESAAKAARGEKFNVGFGSFTVRAAR